MKRKSPAPGMGQRLFSARRKSDYSINPTSIKHSRLLVKRYRQDVLEEIAERWFAQGLYPSPCRAMIALLEGV